MYLGGFVHASTLIRLGSLKRVLQEKHHTDAGKIVEVAFQEVKPGLQGLHVSPTNQDIS